MCWIVLCGPREGPFSLVSQRRDGPNDPSYAAEQGTRRVGPALPGEGVFVFAGVKKDGAGGVLAIKGIER